MDDVKQRYFWSCKLMEYFTEHGYSSLSLVGGKSSGPEKELWMIALENKEYNIIHVSSCLQQAEEEYLTDMCNSIEEALSEPVRVFNINLFELTENIYYQQAIDSICLLPNKNVEEKYLKLFPQLDKVLYVSENVNKDTDDALAKTRASLKKKFKENRKKRIIPMGTMFKVVSIICIVIFLAITITAKVADINTVSAAIAFGGYYKAFITVLGQYWRFITSGFVHSGLIHLGCNLYALFEIGRIVENEYGTVKTFVILILGIVFGNVLVFIVDSNVVAYGLSGGINALFGALFINCALKGYLKDRNIRNKLLSNLMVNIAISLLPNISLLAHLGGFVIGIFLGLIVHEYTEKSIRNNFIISLVFAIIAVGYLGYKQKDFYDFYLGTDKQVIEFYEKLHLSNGKELAKLIEYYSEGE